LEPLGQKTRLVEQLVFQSVADRDGMVASGMQRGSDDSMDRMDENPGQHEGAAGLKAA
jgi:hypothetical protein